MLFADPTSINPSFLICIQIYFFHLKKNPFYLFNVCARWIHSVTCPISDELRSALFSFAWLTAFKQRWQPGQAANRIQRCSLGCSRSLVCSPMKTLFGCLWRLFKIKPAAVGGRAVSKMLKPEDLRCNCQTELWRGLNAARGADTVVGGPVGAQATPGGSSGII